MGVNTKGGYIDCTLDIKSQILDFGHNDVDTNTQTGATRVALELKDIIEKGQGKEIHDLREENKVLK